MISHYLQNKCVEWTELQEVVRGKKKDFVRVSRKGVVVDVDVSNTLAAIKCEGESEPIVVEVCELRW